MDIFTRSLNAPLALVQGDGIRKLSFEAKGGTVDFEGNVALFKGLASTPVTISNGNAVVLEALPGSNIACTITPGTGTADAIIVTNG